MVLWSWGEHILCQDEIKEKVHHIPVQIPLNHKVKSIACGFEHTLILCHEGLFVLGLNKSG